MNFVSVILVLLLSKTGCLPLIKIISWFCIHTSEFYMLLQSLLTNSFHFRQLVFLLHGKTVLLSQTRNPGMKLLALRFMDMTSIVWPSSKERGTIVLLVELTRKLLECLKLLYLFWRHWILPLVKSLVFLKTFKLMFRF